MSMKKTGFTLIELLVVISIIAVLMAIMMPGLQRARRQAQLTICSNNIHQYTVGLSLAAQNNNGKYHKRLTPLPSLIGYLSIYNGKIANMNEYREMVENLYNSFGSDNPDAFNCPFAPKEWLPTGTDPGILDDPDRITYGKVWRVRLDTKAYYSQTYNIFAGQNYDAVTNGLKWNNSGNSSRARGPETPGSSKDVIVADRNDSYLGLNSWYTVHGKGKEEADKGGAFTSLPPRDAPYPMKFEDSNAGHGDGHVSRTNDKEDLKWVNYSGGTVDNYFLY